MSRSLHLGDDNMSRGTPELLRRLEDVAGFVFSIGVEKELAGGVCMFGSSIATYVSFSDLVNTNIRSTN